MGRGREIQEEHEVEENRTGEHHSEKRDIQVVRCRVAF